MLVLTFSLIGATLLLLLAAALMRVAARARRRKASPGGLSPVGRVGSVEKPLAPEGAVLVDGELWRARLHEGARFVCVAGRVRVTGARGHLLEVEPVE
ncbi:MAG TPA: NfeD family protein [Pyrinomonadaceae bacterium]|nr:NfeD family protein [Pyrinomonadaceae bacterium]